MDQPVEMLLDLHVITFMPFSSHVRLAHHSNCQGDLSLFSCFLNTGGTDSII